MNKNKQHGGALAVVLGLFGLAVAVVLAIVMMVISANNYAATAEEGLKGALSNNQNILGQYTLKVQEVVQIPTMYKDDLKEVLKEALSARYGDAGSQASMQWIKEHAINFDNSIYTKIQTIIEAGRNEFQNAQTNMIDKRRSYQTELRKFPRGFIMTSFLGYPTIDLEQFKPVVAADTLQQFNEGVSAPVKLR